MNALDRNVVPGDSRHVAVSGNWNGKMVQDIQDTTQELSISASFSTRGTAVEGELTIHGLRLDGPDKIRIILTGLFVEHRFLSLEYKYSDLPGSLQFGTVILKLNDAGRKMAGKFAGYGAFSEAIVSGSVELVKAD